MDFTATLKSVLSHNPRNPPAELGKSIKKLLSKELFLLREDVNWQVFVIT